MNLLYIAQFLCCFEWIYYILLIMFCVCVFCVCVLCVYARMHVCECVCVHTCVHAHIWVHPVHMLMSLFFVVVVFFNEFTDRVLISLNTATIFPACCPQPTTAMWYSWQRCSRKLAVSGLLNIKQWTGLEWNILLRKAENRKEWRKLVVKSTVVPQRSAGLQDRWDKIRTSQ